MHVNLDQFATVNQDQAHESRSDRYGFVSTKQICNVLADHGWLPTTVKESSVRSMSKKGFQKHLVTFRQSNELELKNVGDEILELRLKGSHDGSSGFEMMIGMLVLKCLNGLTVSKGESSIISIRHNKNAEENASKAILTLLDTGPEVFAQVAKFKELKMSDAQQVSYAQEAIELLSDSQKFIVKPVDLLSARREDDKHSDLWHTFNRVQENFVRGGIARTNLKGKSRKTREIKNIDRSIKVNRELWELTERTAQLLLN